MKRSWESLVRQWLNRASKRSARRWPRTLTPSAAEVLEARSLLSAAVSPAQAPDAASNAAQPNAGDSALQQIDHFVIVYQENWSFDGLYGSFPGANGIANASPASLSQIDRLTGHPYTSQLGQPFDLSVKGPALTTPPQPVNNGAVDPRFPTGLNTLAPYDLGA